MHPTSTASFFPTAKELSSGVQWFKDHPVLAAAAATAVSVITYLNALELAEADGQRVDDAVVAAAALSSRHRKPTLIRCKGATGVTNDSKLSAAVSWCDEHGGSLTQVFEDEQSVSRSQGGRFEDSDSDDEARDNVVERFQDVFQQHRATRSGGLRKSVTTQQLDAAAAAAAAVNDSDADAAQTDSPQWGCLHVMQNIQAQYVIAKTTRELCRYRQLANSTYSDDEVDAVRAITQGVHSRKPNFYNLPRALSQRRMLSQLTTVVAALATHHAHILRKHHRSNAGA